ncbi:BamA/TamA family outer membrane protein [Piscinibacter gummiphilus]|uniref:Uncharacterized protein n=1 Tax=Piscinibacter gummiphilus TaxID=946333 RepID=A0A1W6L7R4_9BURK|nr:BamA/TamA family outer membrane protein [Piscinibacter gummiphilus]ARN20256.1 hypothetical protein A4W93_10275 [Piscinibacter gummiphilus]ATU64927.1 hypothetical protein CPZ87_10350 [Piscinibacter gummiphilus]GLS96440.1 glyceraldehyde-3-phosphate dehydrogenase [Piscinibacter gummiphilus]
MRRRGGTVRLAGGVLLVLAAAAQAQYVERAIESGDGGMKDSTRRSKDRGWLPVPILITEPAVGYGAGAAVLLFRDNPPAREGGDTPRDPDVYGIAAFATENGTWGAGGGGMVSFADDRYRWRGVAARTSLDLTFYGEDGQGPALGYNLDGWMSVQQAMMRIGEHDSWLVARWNYLSLASRFDHASDVPRAGDIDRADTASGLGISYEYDSRDNLFTPSRGWTGAIDLTFYDPAFGSDTRFQSYRGRAFAWWPVAKDVVVGGRVDLRAVEGRTPFYMLPYVSLRGVPAMRLQGTRAGVLESEVRWSLTPLWGVVGFVGGGRAWGPRTDFSGGADTVAYGGGVRYQAVTRLGLWVGLDWAKSTQDRAFYIQVGNAWH